MAFTSFVDHAIIINIHPNSSVSRSNSDFCELKLIAFLGNYSHYSPCEQEGVATRD